ncbi:epoxide hydrolase [Rhodococcus rhodochrous]|uniref:alpha/beta fold hydrolase n=1 Tax=Rhodococcus rhodochrous TaxID=1829 RepID=UPI0007514FD0|nr:alpha/beta hydrolase [Rhodococcus rhodochrous]MDJ0397649.1 alpha/beta hydrolase [Rhodococcus rhodochrous]MDO1483918.1 alpha/beta hydrolase [Rhodococcus rhodochrous]SNV28952.1 epoxide hydrolase [Rhodococcus rhodochrous]
MGSRIVEVDGFTWNIDDRGDGPAVVMCHGFPGLGYSYRHQFAPLVDAGYRAVAPDMPGYGRTDRPREVEEYTNVAVADRLVRLLDVLGIDSAVVVGHDFGAPVAWTTALRHPNRVAGLVLLAVPYSPDRMPARPSEIFRGLADKHFLHLHYFQEPGVAEAELDPRPREFLQRLFFALSGGYRYLDVWSHPSDGRGYLDVLPTAPDLPWDWLADDELAHYAAEFARTGFGGGLSWYRAYDANWEASRPYEGAKVQVPTLFVAGDRDPVVAMSGPSALERMRAFVPDLRGVHLLEGAGHFVQMERRDEVNDLLLRFLSGIRIPTRTAEQHFHRRSST